MNEKVQTLFLHSLARQLRTLAINHTADQAVMEDAADALDAITDELAALRQQLAEACRQAH